mgnify:CR=1 FL=1
MIKFFRKIRLNLINEGKTTQYLKYAIGEIVLVVVGILLALQINNWNELKKDKQLEKRYLKNLTEELKKVSKACRKLVKIEDKEINAILDEIADSNQNHTFDGIILFMIKFHLYRL